MSSSVRRSFRRKDCVYRLSGTGFGFECAVGSAASGAVVEFTDSGVAIIAE